MEQIFESLSVFEFQRRFPDDRACLEYIATERWRDGFVCPQCGHTHYYRGVKEFDRQCTSCNRLVTPTSGTLFHRIRFPLLKAFWIIYYMSTNKKGISSCELSRKLVLRQKTCWAFRQKVAHAMKSGGQHPMTGKVEVDEMVVGGIAEGVTGRKNGKKKLVVLAIEKRGKGVSRVYGRVISRASSKELGYFMRSVIDPSARENRQITRLHLSETRFCGIAASLFGRKRAQFPRDPPRDHGIQGVVAGYARPSRAPASLRRRILLPFQPQQHEGRNFR